MTPRPRKARNKALPPNLYEDRRGGVSYYRFRNPINGNRVAFGSDRAKAIQAARLANARLEASRADNAATALAGKAADGQGPTFGAFVAHFETAILPGRRKRDGSPLADKTLAEYRIMLRTFVAEWGALSFEAITLSRVAGFLRRLPPRASNAHRSLLVQVWAHAVAEGAAAENLPAKTIPRDHVVTRARLTLEQFRALYAAAPGWFRNALELALHTLQRREDLVAMRWEHVTPEGLVVKQQKVRGHGAAGNLIIPIGAPLAAVLEQCRRDNPSPFLLARAPERQRQEYLAAKAHPWQISPEVLTRTFQDLRDAALGPLDNPPTFHELRALGADLYRAGGWEEEAVQGLLGHTSSRMTKHYLARHGREQFTTTAPAGIDLCAH
jgi:integrase